MGRPIAVLTCLYGLWMPGQAYAHGGGLDACGGHNDRKRGGYHVHRMANFCACYPEQSVCKEESGKEKYGKPKR